MNEVVIVITGVIAIVASLCMLEWGLEPREYSIKKTDYRVVKIKTASGNYQYAVEIKRNLPVFGWERVRPVFVLNSLEEAYSFIRDKIRNNRKRKIINTEYFYYNENQKETEKELYKRAQEELLRELKDKDLLKENY